MGNETKCLYCGRDSKQVPLIALEFAEQAFWICPQHLPVLIHKPEQIADKLPGATFLDGPEIHHHD
jgi:hypothetical protein